MTRIFGVYILVISCEKSGLIRKEGGDYCMFSNIGTTELVVVFLILVLLFGGKKLPELARGVGDSIREFKKASKE